MHLPRVFARLRSSCVYVFACLMLVASARAADAGGFVVLRGGGTPTVWFYETGLQRWSQLIDLPVSVGDGGAVAALGTVYVLRGGGTSEVYRYSQFPVPAWTRLPDFPEPVGPGAAMTNNPWSPNQIVAIAGGGSTRLWALNLATNTWTNVATLPAPAGPGSALSHGSGMGTSVMLGGQSAVHRYEDFFNTWANAGTVPSPAGVGGSIAGTYSGCSYVLPGGANGAAFYSLSNFFSCTGQQLADFPVPPAAGTALVSSSDQAGIIYAIAGGDRRSVFQYDGFTNTWSALMDAPAPIGAGGGAAEFRGTNLGMPIGYPVSLPAFTGTASISIDEPITNTSQEIRGSGLPPSASFCVNIAALSAGCGSTTPSGTFHFAFAVTGIPEVFPRVVDVIFWDGPVYSGTQTDGSYPHGLSLTPAGALVLSAPVHQTSASIHGTSFPRSCTSSFLSAKNGAQTLAMGGFPTWFAGDWYYNFNYPAAAATAEFFRWTGFGNCNGYLLSGANPGGAYPRTLTMTDATGHSEFSASPASLTFGVTPIGVLSAPQSITITNTGTGPMVIRDVAFYNGDAFDFNAVLTGGSCSFGLRAVEPGSSCTVQVRFRPTAEGFRTAQMGVAYTDGAAFQLFTVSGGQAPDTTPPVISCAADPSVIWPPNGRSVPVHITVNASDAGSGLAGWVLDEVTTNEAGAESGVTGFAIGAPSVAGGVVAARHGGGSGRVYAFRYVATDNAGNTASCTATVTVPHDQRK